MNDPMKHDQGKLRFDLIEPWFTEGLAQILTYGVEKYGRDYGWKTINNLRSRALGALHRHINAWQQGEIYDPESGLHHLHHAQCNLMFLVWTDKEKEKDNEDPILRGHTDNLTPGTCETWKNSTVGVEFNAA